MKYLSAAAIVLLLAPHWANTQAYSPLIDSNIYRDELWGDGEAGLCYYKWGSHLWFGNDTLIQGRAYRPLKSSPVVGAPEAPAFCPPYTTDTTYFEVLGWYREDTLERRVYVLDRLGEEGIWYDFSLLPGDSIYSDVQGRYLLLRSIELEVVYNGDQRRVFYFEDGPVWIEGIGNKFSFLEPGAPMCICWHELCVYEVTEAGCVRVVDIPTPAKMEVRVYPNPSHGSIWVEAPPGTFLQLASPQGHILYRGFTKSNKELLELETALRQLVLTIGQGEEVVSRVLLLRE